MTDRDQEISAVLHRLAEREEIPDFVMPTAASAPKPRRSKRHWYRWSSLSIATAGAVLFAAGVGTYVSPDFAAQVRSWTGQAAQGANSHKENPSSTAQASKEAIQALFGLGNVDRGIERAMRGYAQKINASVTDQGITLEVKAILADPTRVFVSYQIKKEDGSLLDPKLLRKTLDKVIALTDDKNQRLTNGHGGGWDEKNMVGYLQFSVEEEQGPVPEQMKLLIDVNKMGTVEGNWKLEVPFSVKEAIAATRISQVEKEYTTPQGLQIALRTITEAPSATVLRLETKWDEAAKKRLAQYSRDMTGKTQNHDYAPFVPYQQYQLEYRILDKDGRVVTAYQQEDKRLEQGMLKEGRVSRDQYGHFIWNTAYVPFEGSGPFTFVLDAVHVAEPAALTIAFQSEKLSAEPKRVEYEGNEFTVKSLEKQQDQTSESTALEMEMAFRDISAIEHVWWEITDQSGKSYPINGAAFDSVGEDSQGRKIVRMTLNVAEMEQIPQQLTLSLSAVTKRYADVQWSVDLPLK